MSDPSYNAAGTSGAAQGTTAGSNAGQEAKSGVKEAYGATEKLRTGINSFFDETIQPSASRDASHGETARHRPGTHDPSQNLYTQATTGNHSTSGTTSTGSQATGAPVAGAGPTAGTSTGSSGREFSADAKKLGSDIMGAIRGSTNKSGSNNTT